jgi:hypothetical protein
MLPMMRALPVLMLVLMFMLMSMLMLMLVFMFMTMFVFMFMTMFVFMYMVMSVLRGNRGMEFRRLAFDEHPHILGANPVFRDVRNLKGKFPRRQNLLEFPDQMRLRQIRPQERAEQHVPADSRKTVKINCFHWYRLISYD